MKPDAAFYMPKYYAKSLDIEVFGNPNPKPFDIGVFDISGSHAWVKGRKNVYPLSVSLYFLFRCIFGGKEKMNQKLPQFNQFESWPPFLVSILKLENAAKI